MAGAKTSIPVVRMNSSATGSDCRCASSSEPMSSSTPVMASISPSTAAPWERASATTSTVCRSFSSTGSRDASNRTEFHPLRRQALSTSRSGQWSRCRLTGTSIPAVSSRHIANSRSRPTLRTVLTDVWTITGERCSTAAASTASMLRSLTTFIAATPYRSANARSTISFIETTGTRTSLRQQGESTCGCHGSGSVKTPVSPGDFPYLPALPGPRPPGEFRAVARARLAQHGAGVFLHRLDREHQPLGDELVGQPLLHEAAHLAFPARQGRLEVVGTQAAVQLGEYGPGQDGLAAA